MNFWIERAKTEDVNALAEVMDRVADNMNNPAWFIRDDAAFIGARIGSVPLSKEDRGFVLKAMADTDKGPVLAGFFMVDFPGTGERNLGHHLNWDEEKLKQVAHMDSVVILPEFRGNGLQYRLMEQAEALILAETDFTKLLATVHPDNAFSLHNILKQGYEIAGEVMKYGTYRRYVVKKEF